MVRKQTSSLLVILIDPSQRWRGNVKARHFVLALRDYFREQFDEMKSHKANATPTITPRCISKEDEWTLEYINITRLQPILEAFDDDASGFITVAEVNTLTKARPDDWRSDTLFPFLVQSPLTCGRIASCIGSRIGQSVWLCVR